MTKKVNNPSERKPAASGKAAKPPPDEQGFGIVITLYAPGSEPPRRRK